MLEDGPALRREGGLVLRCVGEPLLKNHDHRSSVEKISDNLFVLDDGS